MKNKKKLKTVFFNYNLTNPEDNFGLATFARDLLKNINPSKELIIIDVNLKVKKNSLLFGHKILNFHAPRFIRKIEPGLKDKLSNLLKEINKESKIDQILVQDFLFEYYLDNDFLKQTNIKKIMFIQLLNRGLFNSLVKQPRLQHNLELEYHVNINYMEFLALRDADLVLANSDFTKSEINKHYPELSFKEGVEVLKLGVDKELFGFSPCFNGKTLYFGRFVDQKGLVYLFDDLKAKPGFYKDNSLLVSGFGFLEKEVLSFERLGVVKYLGNLQKDELRKVLRKVEFCVFPSVYEPWCLALTEAMSMGKIAIVQSGPSGLTEQVKDGYNGFYLDFTTNSVADKIKELKSGKYDLEKISKNARKSARDIKESIKVVRKFL
ncbi:MAG: glycosyltransferase family 4 protein [Candidatus Woesearchaeota archaeon]